MSRVHLRKEQRVDFGGGKTSQGDDICKGP